MLQFPRSCHFYSVWPRLSKSLSGKLYVKCTRQRIGHCTPCPMSLPLPCHVLKRTALPMSSGRALEVQHLIPLWPHFQPLEPQANWTPGKTRLLLSTAHIGKEYEGVTYRHIAGSSIPFSMKMSLYVIVRVFWMQEVQKLSNSLTCFTSQGSPQTSKSWRSVVLTSENVLFPLLHRCCNMKAPESTRVSTKVHAQYIVATHHRPVYFIVY